MEFKDMMKHDAGAVISRKLCFNAALQLYHILNPRKFAIIIFNYVVSNVKQMDLPSAQRNQMKKQPYGPLIGKVPYRFIIGMHGSPVANTMVYGKYKDVHYCMLFSFGSYWNTREEFMTTSVVRDITLLVNINKEYHTISGSKYCVYYDKHADIPTKDNLPLVLEVYSHIFNGFDCMNDYSFKYPKIVNFSKSKQIVPYMSPRPYTIPKPKCDYKLDSNGRYIINDEYSVFYTFEIICVIQRMTKTTLLHIPLDNVRELWLVHPSVSQNDLSFLMKHIHQINDNKVVIPMYPTFTIINRL